MISAELHHAQSAIDSLRGALIDLLKQAAARLSPQLPRAGTGCAAATGA